MFGYVANDPVNWVDPEGMSAKDVSRIKSIFADTVAQMTSSGMRTDPGAWNNIQRSFYNVTGKGNKFLGCGEQADYMSDVLSQQSYDDKWTFSPVDYVIHHLIEGRSSNPSDPVLRIDLWANTIKEE